MAGLVFLDFDGVICDSLMETLVSSWRGYFLLYGKEEPSVMPVSLRADFARLRPYVRAGEDFILIHELIAAKIRIRSQREFDVQLAKQGERRIARFRECFYQARSDLLARDRKYWIALNRIYPHVRPHLHDWALSPSVFILSTKKAPFVLEILTGKGIPFEPAQVLSCAAKEKKNTILRTMTARGGEKALFIDDQIDHLASVSPRHPRISGCLASWGYVQPQWLEDSRGVEVLRPSGFADRVQSWLGD